MSLSPILSVFPSSATKKKKSDLIREHPEGDSVKRKSSSKSASSGGGTMKSKLLDHSTVSLEGRYSSCLELNE